MRFEPRHAFIASQTFEDRRPDEDGPLPPEIAFLRTSNFDPAALQSAMLVARCEGTCAARALIAYGRASAAAYYHALALHLGLQFVTTWPKIAPLADPAAAHRAGRVRLAATDGAIWLAAPEGPALRALLSSRQGRPTDLAITTPAHLAAIIHFYAQGAIAQAASETFPDQVPRFSAKGALDGWASVCTGLALICGGVLLAVSPRLLCDGLGLMFFAGICFRLIVGAAGLGTPHRPDPPPLADDKLPPYTILLPLHQEAAIMPDLLAALSALDYPRTKLDVLALVEPEDHATQAALAAADLPPWLHVVFGPVGGTLRTKPRALNIGLLMARGDLLTVYDAEDRPEPDQLRRAAAFFGRAPADLACVQARLAIDNGATSLLARLFAIEYAALYDVLNIGFATLGLPLPLGGTSNHFHVPTLRAVGGWDAWNVTEDADLGLRLAQLGYRVDCFASTTREAAPDRFPVWMRQRRRWTKGWMQTFLVLAHDVPGVLRRLGWSRSGALVLLFVNLVVGPLLFPVFASLVAYDLLTSGVPNPRNPPQVLEATLATAVLFYGVAATLGLGYCGLKVRGLLRFLPSLPLLLPYQLMISAAAWMGLADLVRRPHHWHKTPHHPAVETS